MKIFCALTHNHKMLIVSVDFRVHQQHQDWAFIVESNLIEFLCVSKSCNLSSVQHSELILREMNDHMVAVEKAFLVHDGSLSNPEAW